MRLSFYLFTATLLLSGFSSFGEVSCSDILLSQMKHNRPRRTARPLGEVATFIFPQLGMKVDDQTNWGQYKQVFLSRIVEHSTILETGASVGRAATEIAQEKDVSVIAVDVGDHVRSHDLKKMDDFDSNHDDVEIADQMNWSLPLKGTYTPEIGFAEDVLIKYVNKVDFLFDVWGAWPYTPKRILLIERIYNALNSGGQARLYCPSWFSGQTQQIAQLLVKKFPEIFSIDSAVAPHGGLVLIIKKHESLPILNTGLQDGRVLSWEGSGTTTPLVEVIENGRVVSPVEAIQQVVSPRIHTINQKIQIDSHLELSILKEWGIRNGTARVLEIAFKTDDPETFLKENIYVTSLSGNSATTQELSWITPIVSPTEVTHIARLTILQPLENPLTLEINVRDKVTNLRVDVRN